MRKYGNPEVGKLYKVLEHFVPNDDIPREVGIGLCLESLVEGPRNHFGSVFLMNEQEGWFDNSYYEYIPV